MLDEWEQRVHPDDKEAVQAALNAHLAQRTPLYTSEHRLRCKDGSYKWILDRGKVVSWDENGKPRRVIGTHSDITDRKRVEAALRENEQNYQSFFDTIGDMLFVLDQQGNMLWTNAAVSRRLHYTAQELYGQNVLTIHPAERRSEAAQIVADMLAGKTEHCPVPVVAKEGNQIPVETRVISGKWSGQKVIFGVTKDISALKASEEKFAKVFQISPALLAISDLENGSYLDVNETFLRTLGYQRAEVIGHSSLELNIFSDPHQRAQAVQIMQAEGRLHDFETVIQNKDGQHLYGLFSAEYIQLQDQRVLLTMMSDITERKRAEEALRASEERYRTLFENLPIPVFTKDLEGRYTSCNQEALKYLSTNPLDHIDAELLPPAIAETFRETDQKVITRQAALEFEELFPLPSGSAQAWILSRKVPLRDHNGRINGILGVSLDITERKRLESELQTQHNFMTTVINTMGQGLTATEDGRFVLVNPAYARMVGQTPEELLGKRPQDVTMQEDQAILAQAIADRQAGRTTTYETRFLRPDGVQVHALITGVPNWRDGNVVGAIAVITDLTERIQMEEQLRASEELYRQMFAEHSAVMLLLDPGSGAIVDANMAAAEFYDYPLDALRQMNISQINALDTGLVARTRHEILTRAKNYFVFPHRLASGELRDVEIYAVPIQTSKNVVLYSIIHDVTARRQAEAQLRYLGTHDALTGLYNRAFFESEMTRLEQGREYPISIVVADIDNLKITNDLLGHPAGDELLKQVASVFRSAFRGSDIIARLGGDEFAVLLPGADSFSAGQILTRVKRMIADANARHAAPGLQLSLGVATADKGNLNTPFREADERMYTDKRMRKQSVA